MLLRIAAMRESLERIGRFDAQRARDRFLSAFVPHCTQHIESGGKPVGFVVVKPMADGLFLEHLYIHPDCQRQGIGRWVLQQVFHEADVLGQTIKVGALKGSEANRFYVRHGFRLVEQTEWDNYYLREARPLGGTT
ncbi:GNAT family N-acetyltransferase [Noviherbaspirillum sp.]|uniref:GNAT family N-acetyltransferase n=1 Tax=Noviherbaspirillum sp. TaxID=1926288 RepID=UPI002FE137EA